MKKRWTTPFASWIDEFGGVGRVAARLSEISPGTAITPKGIYNWIEGRHVPSPDRALAIVELSGGRLTIDQIYSHRSKVKEPAT